ncbi:hypothetical protein FQR65_LT16214 [Abscondita terminalis]|nr:hypothetical protein FQR65_LT16214 [Abscondita terminalis]
MVTELSAGQEKHIQEGRSLAWRQEFWLTDFWNSGLLILNGDDKKLKILSVFWLSAFAQKTHTVIAKDNPYSISRKSWSYTGFSFYTLESGCEDTETWISGDIVVISANRKKCCQNITAKTNDRSKICCKAGGSFVCISRDYHVSLADIRKLNPELGDGLQIGQKINLPLANIKKYGSAESVTEKLAEQEKVSESNPVETPSDTKTYVVLPKDTYYRLQRNSIFSERFIPYESGLEEKGLQPGCYVLTG